MKQGLREKVKQGNDKSVIQKYYFLGFVEGRQIGWVKRLETVEMSLEAIAIVQKRDDVGLKSSNGCGGGDGKENVLERYLEDYV